MILVETGLQKLVIAVVPGLHEKEVGKRSGLDLLSLSAALVGRVNLVGVRAFRLSKI